MAVYLRACTKCRTKRTTQSDRRGRKTCAKCKWAAYAPPSLGRKSLGLFATKAEAETAEREALVASARGVQPISRKVSFDGVVAAFLAHAEATLEAKTVERYRELWRLHAAPALGNRLAAKLNAGDFTALYDALLSKPVRKSGRALSRRTIHHLHRFLHHALAWAKRQGLIGFNPVTDAQPPRPEQSEARALTSDEAAAFLDAASETQWYPFFVLALTTGMRRGELVALQWSAIDQERGMVAVRQAFGDAGKRGQYLKSTKTGRARIVPLSAAALDALRRLRAAQAANKLRIGSLYEDQGFVFAGEDGAPIPLDAPTKAFARTARTAGLKGVTLHSLRHTAATWALAGGTDVRTAAALLGHRSPNLTLATYGHVVAGMQERAVELIGDVLERAQARRRSGENRPA